MRNFSQEHCGENKKEFVQVITFLRIERGKKERGGEEGWGGGGLLLLFAPKGDEYSKTGLGKVV